MTLVATMARRSFRLWISYPVEAVVMVGIYYAIFLVLFVGAKTFGGPSVTTGDTLSAIAIGYVVFFMTQQSYQGFQAQITQESTAGTLEQLALSRYGLLPVLLTDFLVQSAITTVQFGVVLIPIMATTGRWLHFDVVSVVPIAVLMMSGVVGLGLLMGGLAMVFKRVGGVAGILQMSFLFLVAAPVDRYPLLKLLPVAHGNTLLREVLVQGRSVYARASELLILLVVSAAYLAVGCAVFNRMDRLARDRALLGQY